MSGQGKAVVVLLSGGLDSATVLAMARAQGLDCHCLSLDYGQRHRAELVAAERVARALGAAGHRTIALDLRAFGGSALTDSAIDVPTGMPGATPPVGTSIALSASAEPPKARRSSTTVRWLAAPSASATRPAATSSARCR